MKKKDVGGGLDDIIKEWNEEKGGILDYRTTREKHCVNPPCLFPDA